MVAEFRVYIAKGLARVIGFAEGILSRRSGFVAQVQEGIATGHPATHFDELMPGNFDKKA
jgi:hypothetical protein